MNRENLTKLVNGLIGLRQDPIEVEHFTLAIWARTTSCGTFGCAIGTAAVKGWIPGLRMRGPTPFFESDFSIGWHAVVAAFDITMDEAQWLFNRIAYPENASFTRGLPALDSVITRIDGVLAEGFPTITSAILKKFPLPIYTN